MGWGSEGWCQAGGVKGHQRSPWESEVTAAPPPHSADPVAPLAPADLRVVGEVVHSDGSVSVEIAWAPPPEPDIPPRHFRVTWGKAMGGERRRMTVDAVRGHGVGWTPG